MENPKLIDLFSGCGGFSYGFEQEGFDVVLGIDNWDIALDTFAYNHKDAMTLNLDLHKKSSIPKIFFSLGNSKIDLLIAGPPCQGFSLTGTRDFHDKRNSLFESVFALADVLDPKVLIIENVPGIINLYGGDTKRRILEAAKFRGYQCEFNLLYAPNFGIPQIRKRVFFIATKSKDKLIFPQPTNNPENYETCGNAISDLPSLTNNPGGEVMNYDSPALSKYQELMRKDSKVIHNHQRTEHHPHVINVISQVPEGGDFRDLPPGVGESRKFNEAWTRYHRNFPSKTIDTGHRNHFHYKYNRVPTVRENARLQSFPDIFKFLGSRTSQYKQVGNAVPPILANQIAKLVREIL